MRPIAISRCCCGYQAYTMLLHNSTYIVVCDKCPLRGKQMPSARGAIQKWNTMVARKISLGP